MLSKIISGCQTGADIAGIDAAIANNFPYGGWVPEGRRTSVGLLPDRYILQEMPTESYPKRTEQNVIDSDGTVIFTHGKLSGGSDLTRKPAIKHGKPWIHQDMIALFQDDAVRSLVNWVKEQHRGAECCWVLILTSTLQRKDYKAAPSGQVLPKMST